MKKQKIISSVFAYFSYQHYRLLSILYSDDKIIVYRLTHCPFTISLYCGRVPCISSIQNSSCIWLIIPRIDLVEKDYLECTKNTPYTETKPALRSYKFLTRASFYNSCHISISRFIATFSLTFKISSL